MKGIDSQDSRFDPPPSYAESIAASPNPIPFSSAFTTTRSGIISSLLSTHIHPHLHRSARNGLSSRTLLLIPSNVSTLRPVPEVSVDPGSYLNPFQTSSNSTAFINETVIGFPSSENILLIRLQGDANSLEFWHQDTVIRDLTTRLQAELGGVGLRVVAGSDRDMTDQSAQKKRAPNARVGWRPVDERALRDGEVRVGIEMRDVSLRVENVMGLYETRGGKAIVIKVEFGGG